jgi:hypothetical protein
MPGMNGDVPADEAWESVRDWRRRCDVDPMIRWVLVRLYARVSVPRGVIQPVDLLVGIGGRTGAAGAQFVLISMKSGVLL